MDRIPILKLGDALLVTIQVDMHDHKPAGGKIVPCSIVRPSAYAGPR
jgi:hypothetical protein